MIVKEETMKRRVVLMLLTLLLVAAPLAFSQEEGGILGVWKEQFASPTYGIALIPGTISGDGLAARKIAIPGLDVRLFQGTNVTKRGGFFTGIELGTLFFSNKPDGKALGIDTYSDSGSTYTDTYTPNLNYTAGMVFLLGKYGYRLDIGFALIGISAGAELGIGARLIRGDFNLSTTLDGFTRTLTWNSSTNPADLFLDAAAEAAIRLGKNFRIVARLGGMLTPSFLVEPNHDAWNATKDDVGGGDTNWTVGEIDALLQRYNLELFPVIITGRVGFSLSY